MIVVSTHVSSLSGSPVRITRSASLPGSIEPIAAADADRLGRSQGDGRQRLVGRRSVLHRAWLPGTTGNWCRWSAAGSGAEQVAGGEAGHLERHRHAGVAIQFRQGDLLFVAGARIGFP